MERLPKRMKITDALQTETSKPEPSIKPANPNHTDSAITNDSSDTNDKQIQATSESRTSTRQQ
jgi:hypothetical protein